MYRIKDQNGNIIDGMVKDVHGSIVVTDVEDYHKYIREKESFQKLNKLEDQVQQLQELIEKLLGQKNG